MSQYPRHPILFARPQAPLFLCASFMLTFTAIALFDSQLFLVTSVGGDLQLRQQKFGKVMARIAPCLSLAIATGFKNVLQLLLTNVAILKFIPLYTDTTSACDDELSDLDSIVATITSIVFWLLFPFLLHLLINTFVPGEVAPMLVRQQTPDKPKASFTTCFQSHGSCCEGKVKARWCGTCGGLTVALGSVFGVWWMRSVSDEPADVTSLCFVSFTSEP